MYWHWIINQCYSMMKKNKCGTTVWRFNLMNGSLCLDSMFRIDVFSCRCLFSMQQERTLLFWCGVYKTPSLLFANQHCRYYELATNIFILDVHCADLFVWIVKFKFSFPPPGPCRSSETWCDPHELDEPFSALGALSRPGCVCEEESIAVCGRDAECESAIAV